MVIQMKYIYLIMFLKLKLILIKNNLYFRIGISGPDLINLQRELEKLDLNLKRIGNQSPTIKSPKDEILIYQILLSVIGGVLGTFCVFLIVIYVTKTRRYSS